MARNLFGERAAVVKYYPQAPTRSIRSRRYFRRKKTGGPEQMRGGKSKRRLRLLVSADVSTNRPPARRGQLFPLTK